MMIIRFKDAETGDHLTERQVRNRAVNMILPRVDKWTANTFEKLKANPVYESIAPEYDKARYALIDGGDICVNGVWCRKWEVAALFEDKGRTADHVKRLAKSACDRAIDSGAVIVDEVEFKTSAKAIALLNTAGADGCDFITKGQVVRLSGAQVKKAKAACSAHVQNCFSHLAKLYTVIDQADDPLSVDVKTGWPHG
jgi:hypothetical protein